MYKERVVASKACQKKWDEQARKVHAEKLKHIKPSIDNSPPQTQVHLENRRKRDQIVEDRLTTIEKHNMILLDRMMTIMKRPTTLDNQNTSKSPSKSLNREAKKRELEKINAENKIILKKLTSAKAYYDHKDWDTFQTNQETYLKNICEYPVQKSASKETTLPKINSQGSPKSERRTRTASPDWHSSPTTSSEKSKTKSRFTKKTIEAHKEWSAEKKYFSDENDSLKLSDLDSDDDNSEKADTPSKRNAKKGKTPKEKGAKKSTKEKEGGEEKDGNESGSDSLGSDFSDSFDESDDEAESSNKHQKETEKEDQHPDADSNSLTASEEKNSTLLSPNSRHQEEFEKDEEEYKPQDEEEEEKGSEKHKGGSSSKGGSDKEGSSSKGGSDKEGSSSKGDSDKEEDDKFGEDFEKLDFGDEDEEEEEGKGDAKEEAAKSDSDH